MSYSPEFPFHVDVFRASRYDAQMAKAPHTSTFHQRWTAFFSTPARNTVLRYAIFAVAVYLLAFSIALARTAQLGTSPIAALPNVCSYVFAPITIGQFQILMNLLMVLGQIALNHSFRRPVEFFQMFMAIALGLLVDLNVFLLQGLPIGGYAGAWAWTLLSIVLLALGVSLELLADAIMMPGEGIVLSITLTTKKPFHRCKVAFDVGCIVAAALLSLVALGGLVGVREGTVATAILTGPIVKVINRLLKPLHAWIPAKPEQSAR